MIPQEKSPCNSGFNVEFHLERPFKFLFAAFVESFHVSKMPPHRSCKGPLGSFPKYRVDQQCCLGGNRPETPRRPSARGLRIFLAKSLVIPAIYTKFKLKFVSDKLEF